MFKNIKDLSQSYKVPKLSMFQFPGQMNLYSSAKYYRCDIIK